jgi:hypothetical protein
MLAGALVELDVTGRRTPTLDVFDNDLQSGSVVAPGQEQSIKVDG